MITEQDIIFDELYPEVSVKLDSILDEVIADIEDEWGIQHSMMMKIVEEWSRKVADRLPLEVITDEKTIKMLKEWEEKQ
jgi:hypothetical protein